MHPFALTAATTTTIGIKGSVSGLALGLPGLTAHGEVIHLHVSAGAVAGRAVIGKVQADTAAQRGRSRVVLHAGAGQRPGLHSGVVHAQRDRFTAGGAAHTDREALGAGAAAGTAAGR